MININIKFYLKFILLLQFLFLFNCTGVKEKVGIIKKAPDEFQVYEKKPLAVPPNFELRPPKDKNLVVIGIPTNNFKQEPGSNKEIKDFCETNFGINFPMSEKTDVIGSNAHPFYKWAKSDYGIGAIPKWNFHKIIIAKNRKIADTFASFTKPSSKKFLDAIEKEIKN